MYVYGMDIYSVFTNVVEVYMVCGVKVYMVCGVEVYMVWCGGVHGVVWRCTWCVV